MYLVEKCVSDACIIFILFITFYSLYQIKVAEIKQTYIFFKYNNNSLVPTNRKKCVITIYYPTIKFFLHFDFYYWNFKQG